MNPIEAQSWVNLGRWLHLAAGAILGTASLMPMVGHGLLLEQWLPSIDFVFFLLAIAVLAQSVLGVSQEILATRPDLAGDYLRSYTISGVGWVVAATMFLLTRLDFLFLL